MNSVLINGESAASKTVFSLIERFERDDRTAIICGSETISYREFISGYRNFGLELVRSGLRKGDRVLVCQKRGVSWLTSIFGIMAAGGIYIPVDREWPSERREFIMKDSGAALMVTDDGIFGADGTPVSSPVFLTGSGTDGIGKLPYVTGDDYCWIYYTSGSTGIPKGAANVHEVMYNNALVCPENIYTACTVSSCTNVLAMLNLAYSFSLADVLISLCNGLKLILATEEERQDPAALAACMQKWQVEALAATPSLLERFLENEQFSSTFRKLKRVGLSGEGLSRSQMELIAGKTDGKLFNGYGSSEMLHCSDALCTAGDDLTAGVPNLKVRLIVLMDDMEAAGPGEEGELLIGGVPAKHALYFGREDLNNEK
ncbi:MAG: AMP-binding protein, partial [Lachnospiraceae bacterium]|nr:AMP-binding protein [Lachnospiraceae bacterium]